MEFYICYKRNGDSVDVVKTEALLVRNRAFVLYKQSFRLM